MIGPLANIHAGQANRGYGESNKPMQCPEQGGVVWREWQEYTHGVSEWEDNYGITVNCYGKKIVIQCMTPKCNTQKCNNQSVTPQSVTPQSVTPKV